MPIIKKPTFLLPIIKPPLAIATAASCNKPVHLFVCLSVYNVETSYFTQLKMCYLMTTFRCPSDILITSWLFTAGWSTWPSQEQGYNHPSGRQSEGYSDYGHRGLWVEGEGDAGLDDKRTYEVLKSDPTPKYKELVGKLSRLKQEGKITQADYDWLYPMAENVPRMYCTLKIHKTGNPLKPIVDYTGSIGYRTSRALADILAPLVGKSDHHLNNSKLLAKEMISVMVEEDEMFISRDVVSLFTNTPIDLALQVIRERLEGDTELHTRTVERASP